MSQSLLVKRRTSLSGYSRPKDPHVKDGSSLKSQLLDLQQEYFEKDREHKLTLKELQQVNNTLKTTKRGYDTMFLCLKDEKETAEKNASITKEKLKASLETVDSLNVNISEKERQRLEDVRKMEEMRSELDKWKTDYKAAVKASKSDTIEKYKEMRGERDRALSEADILRKDMEEANVKIDQLGEEIKEKDRLNNELMKELQDTKKKLEEKVDEVERVQKSLHDCKAEITAVMKVCKKDASSARKKIAAVQGQRNEAFTKIGILEKQMEVLNQLVGCLEEDNNKLQMQSGSSQSEIVAMREELERSQEEFERALSTCRRDLSDAEDEMTFYLKEKGSALADAEFAKMQLQKLENIVCNLERERDYERERNNKPWWKKLFFL